MIVAVNKENAQEWAELVTSLWGDMTLEEAYEELSGLEYEFLYYDNEEPVAFFSLSLRHDYVEGTETSPVAYLEGIYVSPSHRKKGVAGHIIDFTKDWASQKGCTELASDCELDNEISRMFHTKLGFTEANRIICFTMKL